MKKLAEFINATKDCVESYREDLARRENLIIIIGEELFDSNEEISDEQLEKVMDTIVDNGIDEIYEDGIDTFILISVLVSEKLDTFDLSGYEERLENLKSWL